MSKPKQIIEFLSIKDKSLLFVYFISYFIIYTHKNLEFYSIRFFFAFVIDSRISPPTNLRVEIPRAYMVYAST